MLWGTGISDAIFDCYNLPMVVISPALYITYTVCSETTFISHGLNIIPTGCGARTSLAIFKKLL